MQYKSYGYFRLGDKESNPHARVLQVPLKLFPTRITVSLEPPIQRLSGLRAPSAGLRVHAILEFQIDLAVMGFIQ